MIPKKIHYCWFGGRPKPPVVQHCLDTWRTILPDYEIIEWNENNFDVNVCPYVKQAYDKKLYAFVTDYVRLWALYNFGGIYMDSDVEVLKSLDKFLGHRAFTGHETDDLLITATMGSEPGHPWIKILLDYYKNAVLDFTPNTQTISKMSYPWVTKKENGYRYLREGVVIYPIETFCNYDHQRLQPKYTDQCYTMHLFNGSWLNDGRGRNP